MYATTLVSLNYQWYQALNPPPLFDCSEHLAAVIRWTGAADRSSFFTMAEAVEPAAKKQKTEAAGVATGPRFSTGNWVGRMPFING